VRWLLDEMLPPAAAENLRARGHDAVSVVDVGLGAADDAEVYAKAEAEGRVMVTENFGDFATLFTERQARNEPCVPVVFVRRAAMSPRGGLAAQIARRLDTWAMQTPDPLPSVYWP
jgi:predicted nuclease of predicted toxin-antitoxin system